jgi:hypothetical protein
MHAVLITNSANDSISVVQYLWAIRSTLNAVQRRGFGNFFYVALLGHLESLLSTYLRARIIAAKALVPWAELPDQKPMTENGVKRFYPTAPLRKSLESMILGYESDLEFATINKLIELYRRVIGTPLSEAIGENTQKHVTALSNLRNVFAHGRSFILELPFPVSGTATATLQSTSLQFPVQLLIDAGLVDSLCYDGQTHSKFADAFYSDQGMRCFWNAGKEVDASLRSCEQLNLFTRSLLPKELPDLTP